MQAVRPHAYDDWLACKRNLTSLFTSDEQALTKSFGRRAEGRGALTLWRPLALLLFALKSGSYHSFVGLGPSRGLFAGDSLQNKGLHAPTQAKKKHVAWRNAKRFRSLTKMYETEDLLNDLRGLVKQAQVDEAKARELAELERSLNEKNMGGMGNLLRSIRAEEEKTARAHAVATPKLRSPKEMTPMEIIMKNVEKVAKARSNSPDKKEGGLVLPPNFAKTVNEAGFEVGVSLSPEQAEKLGIKPFGDGGNEEPGTDMPKVYTHGPNATSGFSEAFTVPCMNWRTADATERGRLAKHALTILRQFGFVVLESLFSVDEISQLEKAAPDVYFAPEPGLIPQPLRAKRFECPIPYKPPWTSDWLFKNDLVLEVAAGYLQNNLAAGRTKDEQQDGMVQWIDHNNASMDFFFKPEWGPKRGPLLDNPPVGHSGLGSADEQGGFFAYPAMIYAPAGGPSQKRHRDITYPGAAACLTAQVPLTPFTGENGPVAFVPGSHCMRTFPFEVVGCPPVGSVTLYDSFIEHRGIANLSPKDRFALYYEFESRGVFTGYQPNHFGPNATAHFQKFRQLVNPVLRQKKKHHRGRTRPEAEKTSQVFEARHGSNYSKVVRIQDDDVFVEVTPGYSALRHKSEYKIDGSISMDEVGATVGDVKVEQQDAEGIVEPSRLEPPDPARPEIGKTYRDCEIVDIDEDGMAVQVTPVYEAWLHKKSITDDRSISMKDAGFKVGDFVDVKVERQDGKRQFKLIRSGGL